MREPLASLERFGRAEETPDDLAALRAMVRDFFEAEGERSLQRCGGLPSTRQRLRQRLRDNALREAARLIDAPGPWRCAELLAEALHVYETRGGWRDWKHARTLPEGVSPLRKLLHRILRLNDGTAPSLSTIASCARRNWPSILRRDMPTLEASDEELSQ